MPSIGEMVLHDVDKITIRRVLLNTPSPFVNTELTFWKGGEEIFVVKGFTVGENPPEWEMLESREWKGEV
jgi:hypothetical protein